MSDGNHNPRHQLWIDLLRQIQGLQDKGDEFFMMDANFDYEDEEFTTFMESTQLLDLQRRLLPDPNTSKIQ